MSENRGRINTHCYWYTQYGGYTEGGVSQTLSARGHKSAEGIMVTPQENDDLSPLCIGNEQSDIVGHISPVAGTLNCMHDQQAVLVKNRKYVVRRLTPLECCRLQGFPDWWEAGANGSDSARYKMWGNGVALPCVTDILRRIVKEGEQSASHQHGL